MTTLSIFTIASFSTFAFIGLISWAWKGVIKRNTERMKDFAVEEDKVYYFVGEEKVLAEIIERKGNSLKIETADEQVYQTDIDSVYPVLGYPYGKF